MKSHEYFMILQKNLGPESPDSAEIRLLKEIFSIPINTMNEQKVTK